MLDDLHRLREAAAALTQARAAWDVGSANLRATHDAAARKLVITLDPIASARHHDVRGKAVVDHVHDVLHAMRAVIDAALQPPRRALIGAANEVRSALGAADIPDRHWSSVAAAIRNHGRDSPLIGGLPSADATVEEIHDWWAGQDDAARAEAIERFGDSLGRIDGIPIPDRSQCNEAPRRRVPCPTTRLPPDPRDERLRMTPAALTSRDHREPASRRCRRAPTRPGRVRDRSAESCRPNRSRRTRRSSPHPRGRRRERPRASRWASVRRRRGGPRAVRLEVRGHRSSRSHGEAVATPAGSSSDRVDQHNPTGAPLWRRSRPPMCSSPEESPPPSVRGSPPPRSAAC